jgi:type VI secretion system secreted protein Hcp
MRSVAAVPLGLLCSLALAAPSRAVAAQDIFLAIPGLNGESADEQFPGAFEALSVTSGVTSQTAVGGGAGGGAGKATLSPVAVKLRRTTAASAALEEAVLTGQKFAQAVVSVRRAGENRLVFLTYTLTDVTVTSFQREANAAEDAPSESVSLTYAQIRTEYQQQNPDGSAGPIISVCWDVRTNARCP